MIGKQQQPTKKLLLINRDFQFRYTRASVAVGIVSTVLTSIVILYPLFLFKILVVPRFLPAPILAGMLVAAAVNIGMLIIFGVLISHKIAGPMFSMVRLIRKLSSGSWRSQMRLRAGDDLQLIVRNLNELSNSLVALAEKDLEIIEKAIELNKSNGEALKLLTDLKTQILARIEEPPLEGPV
jgi:methyl-accepting chemotaxis protein